jgi:hypothetical protein
MAAGRRDCMIWQITPMIGAELQIQCCRFSAPDRSAQVVCDDAYRRGRSAYVNSVPSWTKHSSLLQRSVT